MKFISTRPSYVPLKTVEIQSESRVPMYILRYPIYKEKSFHFTFWPTTKVSCKLIKTSIFIRNLASFCF